jgi:hypothetical protein
LIRAIEIDAADFGNLGFAVKRRLGKILRGAGVPALAKKRPDFLE